MLLSDSWLRGNSCDINSTWALLTDAHTQNIVMSLLCYTALPATFQQRHQWTDLNSSLGNTWSALTQTQAFLCGPLQSSRSGVTDVSHSQTTSCASSHSTLAENTGLQELFISRLLMMHDSLESVKMCGTCGKHVNVWMKYVFKHKTHTQALMYLHISAITLLSLLYVSVSTFLASVEYFHLRHVEQTHAHTFLQARGEILLTACTEDCRERVPERRNITSVMIGKITDCSILRHSTYPQINGPISQ